LKLDEVRDGRGVIFGHVDIYNGDDKLDGDSLYTRCVIFFSSENGDQAAKVQTDGTGWISEVPS
jgi:hypothetical protein